MSDERDETTKGAMPPSEPPEPEPEQTSDEVDAAKLSDEEAQAAARAFLGTAEPEEEVSVDEAKNMLRRTGAVAEAEPAPVEPAAEVTPEVEKPAAPAQPETDGRRWFVIHTYS